MDRRASLPKARRVGSWVGLLVAGVMAAAGAPRAAQAEAAAPGTAAAVRPAAGPADATSRGPGARGLATLWEQLAEGGTWGKLSLDARLRLELAKLESADEALATTLRTRLGYRSPAWQGLSFFVEGESVLALDDDAYWDGVSSPNGESLVADPETSEINQAYLQLEPELGTTRLRGGRQRITLDDHRFVGNVGWRQNEQTFDAASLRSDLGVENLSLFYAFVWDVNRIFGDKSSAPPATRDFDASSHLARLRYAMAPWLDATLFGYFLDLENRAGSGASNQSYGLRLEGSHAIAPRTELAYLLSYAYQADAADNPVDYGAHYLRVDASLGREGWGRLGVGYEQLGSDDGESQFQTPLATLHAFNGWADAFLDNGGPEGLRDLSAYVAPALPLGLEAKLVYHEFWNDDDGDPLGFEVDALLRKAVNAHLSVLAKIAWFEGRRRGPADRRRVWLQTTFHF